MKATTYNNNKKQVVKIVVKLVFKYELHTAKKKITFRKPIIFYLKKM